MILSVEYELINVEAMLAPMSPRIFESKYISEMNFRIWQGQFSQQQNLIWQGQFSQQQSLSLTGFMASKKCV